MIFAQRYAQITHFLKLIIKINPFNAFRQIIKYVLYGLIARIAINVQRDIITIKESVLKIAQHMDILIMQVQRDVINPLNAQEQDFTNA